MQTYHIFRNGEQFGPFSITEIKRMLASGELASDNLYWVEGMSEWETLSKAFETSAAAGPPPPPLKANSVQANPAQKNKEDRWNWAPFIILMVVTAIIKLISTLFR